MKTYLRVSPVQMFQFYRRLATNSLRKYTEKVDFIQTLYARIFRYAELIFQHRFLMKLFTVLKIS